jgi:hypothetical protein
MCKFKDIGAQKPRCDEPRFHENLEGESQSCLYSSEKERDWSRNTIDVDMWRIEIMTSLCLLLLRILSYIHPEAFLVDQADRHKSLNWERKKKRILWRDFAQKRIYSMWEYNIQLRVGDYRELVHRQNWILSQALDREIQLNQSTMVVQNRELE